MNQTNARTQVRSFEDKLRGGFGELELIVHEKLVSRAKARILLRPSRRG